MITNRHFSQRSLNTSWRFILHKTSLSQKNQRYSHILQPYSRIKFISTFREASDNIPSNGQGIRYVVGSAAIAGIGGSIYYYFKKTKGNQSIDNSNNQHHKIILSPLEATLKLRENQLSFLLQRNNGVYRYDTNQLASNNPIEDTKCELIVPNSKSGGDRLFFGIFDGHAGWNTSQLLSKKLIPYVKEQLDKAYDGYGEYSKLISNKEELISKAIRNGFTELDEEIVIHSIDRLLNTPNQSGGISYINESLLSALSGSCAILAYIDTVTNDLYIACTGDSRAVLGVKDPKTGEWKPIPLSEDQTGRNEREIERLDKEHPGESNIISKGRVFGGLEPTRAFGDSKYKWDRDLQEMIYSKFFNEKRNVPGGERYKTPPYVTARPEVTHHKIGPDDKFLVLATDGLWERLSNAEVIELIGLLIDGRRNGKNSREITVIQKDLNVNGSKQHKEFAFVDENAATHLIRNALGGAAEDVLCAMLSLPSPMSRRWRDDITVTVVFFGKD
ncbi:phophatase 2C family protein [Gigaspora margarita]|uniref:Phophatase 2C family protein n=1 Tax=Gigaspora margarita TaxID=4874 RepID=A0A8H3ZXA3_GIGMA|nr:phophatase 2C family protein [Gigaspora margarita]